MLLSTLIQAVFSANLKGIAVPLLINVLAFPIFSTSAIILEMRAVPAFVIQRRIFLALLSIFLAGHTGLAKNEHLYACSEKIFCLL
ncbi:ORF381 [White spot syndrome virus]|uniref:ORF381 n=1 Tax=White spot syndrome virus TaxID=342409 RepID=A0A2D3I5W8_9VIRU|nr:ORF381 [White spot syndrome virus]